MLEMKVPNRARNPALNAIGAFSLRYSEIPSQVYLGQYIFTGQNWTCACGSSLLTLGTLVCRLVGALYLHIFFLQLGMISFVHLLSYRLYPNQEQLVISCCEQTTCTGSAPVQ